MSGPGAIIGDGADSRRSRDRGVRIDLDRALEDLRSEARADAADLFLTAPVGSDVVMVSQAGRATRVFREQTRFKRGQGFPGLVAETESELICNDLAADPRYLRRSVLRQGFRGYVCTPVWGRGFLGSLNLAFRRDIQQDEEHLRALVESAADRIGPAIELARFEASEPIRAVSFDPDVSPQASFRFTADLVLESLMSEAAATSGLILMPDEDGTLAIAAEAGMPAGARKAAGARIACAGCPAMAGPDCMTILTGYPTPAPVCRAVARGLPVMLCLPLLEPGPARGRTAESRGQAEQKSAGVVLLGYDRRLPYPFAHLSFLHEALPQARLVLNAAQANLRNADRSSGSPGRQFLERRVPAAPGNAESKTVSTRGLLETQCFGRLQIFLDGALIPPEAFGRRRSLKLLKILLVRQGRAVHRDEVVEWLWPNTDGDSAASQFDTALHYLRRGLAVPGRNLTDLVRREGTLVWLEMKDPLWIDTVEFERLAAFGASMARQGRRDDGLAAYQKAVRLYAGDLLECEPAADWCAAERTYFREQYLKILEAVGNLHMDGGEVEQAMAAYRQAIRTEPTREEPHRALMQALRQAGRRAEAIVQFEECQRGLRHDLGLAVSPELVRLRDEIAGEMAGGS